MSRRDVRIRTIPPNKKLYSLRSRRNRGRGRGGRKMRKMGARDEGRGTRPQSPIFLPRSYSPSQGRSYLYARTDVRT